MNVYEIECLARAAASLLETNGSQGAALVRIATAEKLLNRLDAELAGIETGEEFKALQVSSRIKQANLNLLAQRVIAFIAVSKSGTYGGAIYEHAEQTLIELAESLIQEDHESLPSDPPSR